MLISSVSYSDSENTMVKATINGTEWSVLLAAINKKDGEIPRAIKQWIDGGNSIQPYSPPPLPDVKQCSALAGRLVLMNTPDPNNVTNMLAITQTVIDQLPVNDPVRIYWEYATEWNFDSPVIQGMAATLGLSNTQMQALFNATRDIS